MFFETPQVPHLVILYYEATLLVLQTPSSIYESFNAIHIEALLFFEIAVTAYYKGYFIPALPGWRDHKDHESLHKHDCEEALQCEVCLQLWEQLDQVIGQDTGCIQLQSM